MKKILSLISVLLVSISMSAQSEIGTISVMPKIGFSMGDMSNMKDSKSRNAIVAGAEAIYQVTDAFAVSGGLLYSQQGCSRSYKNNGVNTDVTAKYDYLNVPLLAQYYLVKGLAVKLGVQPGLLLSAKHAYKYTGAIESSENVDIKKQSNAIDLAIPVGLSYEYSDIVLDIRYNASLIGTTKKKYLEDTDKNPKHGVLQIAIGYKF